MSAIVYKLKKHTHKTLAQKKEIVKQKFIHTKIQHTHTHI